jgi:hypothetical protein
MAKKETKAYQLVPDDFHTDGLCPDHVIKQCFGISGSIRARI